MTREYIGARYVPYYFENPDGSSNWIQGIAYEALTIVKYASNSFISKKPVPSSIGNPPANPSYWVQTGTDNAQIAEIQKTINDVKTSVEKILHTGKRFVGRNVIIISDSYGNQAYSDNSFLTIVSTTITNLGGRVTTVFNNGASFGLTSNSFLTLLKRVSETDNTITDILVVGGYNDLYNYTHSELVSDSDVKNGIINFANYALETYPFAKISFLPVGWNNTNTTSIKIFINNMLLKMKSYCLTAGIDFQENAIYTLFESGSFISDNVHPSSTGQRLIANTVMQFLINNNVHIHKSAFLSLNDVIFGDNITRNGDINIYETLINNVSTLTIVSLPVNLNNQTLPTIYNGGIKLVTLKNKTLLKSTLELGGYTPCGCVNVRSGGADADNLIAIYLKNNEIFAGYINKSYSQQNVTGLNIYNVNITRNSLFSH